MPEELVIACDPDTEFLGYKTEPVPKEIGLVPKAEPENCGLRLSDGVPPTPKASRPVR